MIGALTRSKRSIVAVKAGKHHGDGNGNAQDAVIMAPQPGDDRAQSEPGQAVPPHAAPLSREEEKNAQPESHGAPRKQPATGRLPRQGHARSQAPHAGKKDALGVGGNRRDPSDHGPRARPAPTKPLSPRRTPCLARFRPYAAFDCNCVKSNQGKRTPMSTGCDQKTTEGPSRKDWKPTIRKPLRAIASPIRLSMESTRILRATFTASVGIMNR